MFRKAFTATMGVGCAVVVGLLLILVVTSVCAAGVVSGLRAPTAPVFATAFATTSIRTAVPQAKTWVAVKQWEGNGAKQTESFSVGSEWRVDWINSGTYLGVYVHDAATTAPVDVPVNTTKVGADSSFLHKAGTYYLIINAAGGWKVAVQEFR